SAKKDTFIVDLLRKAREVLPGEKHYYLTSLEILPHKIWGVDCSKGKKGEYDFVLYDIGMFQHLDVDLQQDLPTKSYAYEDEGKVYGVGSLFEIPRDKKFSFQVHKRQFLNLNDMNHWNLFLKDYSGRHVRAIFGFGLAGEKKESSQLEREFSVVSLNKGISFVNIDFREILDARKNWKNWELQWMELVAPHQKKNRWRYRVESYLFEQKIRRLEAFDFGLDPVKLFSLNGTPVDIPQGKIKRVDENCFQFRLDPLKFQKRFQKLRFLTNPRLTCDWLLFRPGLEREQRLPEIDFRKINPTRYVVRVQKSDQPFWLVFSESFHPNWRAYVRKVNDLTQNGRGQFLEFDEPSSALLSLLRDRGRRIELKRHFAANGYLNTWWVDPKDLGTQLEIERQNESFEIILEFTSQRALEVGWIISGTVLLFCLLGFYLMKRKNRC
ncbi:MAG: hypothetical protein HYZ67_06270, partial [Chlamydiae bacterium]|nr:hypothetical protein [Chlamydiota bacterium]